MTLEQFIASPVQRLWINEPNISVYCRKAQHRIGIEFYPTLDIASVVVKQAVRGHGIFTDFLKRAEEFARIWERYLYVECIQEPRLVDFLRRRGYQFQAGARGPQVPNMYWKAFPLTMKKDEDAL